MEARRGDSGAMAPRPPKLSTGAESRAGAPIGSTMTPPCPQLWIELFVNNPQDFVSFPQENTRCGDDVIRSAERRVGKECVSTCRSRLSALQSKKKQLETHITEDIKD